MIIHDPPQMVLMSLSISALFIFLYFLYNKIYPRKSLSYDVLLFFISLLPLVSLLRIGGYESGDLNLHVAFAIPFFENIQNGILFPVWNQYVLQGYGYPLYLFVYPLPYYLSSLIHMFGFDFITSFKILIAFTFVLSGQGMYKFSSEILKDKKAGFISAIFYLFAPYHLIDMHFRVAIGELLAFAFLPFIFLYTYRLIYKFSRKNFLLFILCFSLLILSHQAMALVAAFFLTVFILVINKEKSMLIKLSIPFLASIGLTSFYWIPLIYASKFTYLLSGKIKYNSLYDLIYSPHLYGFLFQGNSGELYLIVGYFHLFVIFIFIVFYFKGKIKKPFKNLGLFMLFSSIILMFMITSSSEFIWNNIFLLKGFQFSYRLLLFVNLFLSVLAGLTLINIKSNFIVKTILILVIFSTILNWSHRRTIPSINDITIKNSLISSLNNVGPGRTIWNKTEIKKRDGEIEVIKGEVVIERLFRSQTNHTYKIIVNSDMAALIDNTTYFPGWNLTINNTDYPIKSENGLINFTLLKGVNKVTLDYSEQMINKIAKLISLTTFIVIIIISLKGKKIFIK